MTSRGASNARGLAAFAAIVGVLLQLFVFAVHGPANARASLANAQAGEPTIICTAHGIATVMLDTEGNPVDAPSPMQTRPWCDLCPAMAGLVLAPPSDAFVLALQSERATPPAAPDAVIEVRSVGAHRNRGPPFQQIA